MPKLYVAFLWHHHQPYYGDSDTGACSLPWVRLHGLAAYVGMARMHYEVPEMRATFNLVPSLLEQIQGYVDGALTDEWLELTRKPADSLNEQEVEFVLNHFFSAQRATFIEPNPRYAELHAKRGLAIRTAREASKLFTAQDLRDLQVWATLAWFHPLVVEYDKALRELVAKGKGFSEADKAILLAKQQETLEQIIPLYRDLQDEGRIEIATSPYYHPIMPLLCNMASAREAMPNAVLPSVSLPAQGDADAQLRKAIAAYEREFGRRPAGMWPPEGSVSPRALEMMSDVGIQWAASDSDILARSQVDDGQASPYEPYAAAAGQGSISMVFRDHELSDLIGFQYTRMPAKTAADDFVSRLGRLADAVSIGRPPLVAVILDGENPWEHYPAKGVDFLRQLYTALVRRPDIEPTTLADYLEQHPPTRRLSHVFSGSWIFHSFSTWVGNEECNTAWEHLAIAREALCRQQDTGALTDEQKAKAWEELYIAEGSDWFWWYGDDHTSAYDAQFDAAFRTHLKNIYLAIGLEPPAALDTPIQRESAPLHTTPTRLLDVEITGRERSYFEWSGAGEYDVDKDAGSMQRVSGRAFDRVLFGFNLDALFLRVDLTPRMLNGNGHDAQVAVDFVRPQKATYTAALTRSVEGGHAQWKATASRTDSESTAAQAACDKTFEIAIPFDELGSAPGQTLEFYVSYCTAGNVVQRSPEGGPIAVAQPSEDFEREVWVL